MRVEGEAGAAWQELAKAVSWNIQPFINGGYRPSKSSETFENINPATEMALCDVAIGCAADIDKAVSTARRRFEDGCWSDLPAFKRAEILIKLAELVAEHRAELALLDCLEMGKPIQAALHDAGQLATRLLRSWAGFADKLIGMSAPMSGGAIYFNVYEPRGVIGAITPWNFPVVNAVYKLGPALAAGNTIVLKPSELSSGSALKLAELAVESGIPEGVFNVVPGLGTTVGLALAQHMDVDLLSFTGSTTTGRRVAELSARSKAKPLLLECGGKSPHVVFRDVENFDAVAEAVVQGVLLNQGQVCSAHTRLIVHADIKRTLLDKVVSLASECQPNDPLYESTTFGPLASAAQRTRVKGYIEQGLRAGANAILKGEIKEEGGCYVSPTIFDRVTDSMSIVKEEIFGPVLCVQEFRTEEEALALANGTNYGLAATVWTRDMGLGRRLAHRIKAGAVMIRTSGCQAAPGCVLSYEPRKSSGFGSEAGLGGLHSYSSLKSVSFNGS